jgi:hypothetical protein
MHEMRNAHGILITKPEIKRLLVIFRHRWQDSNKMNVKEIGCEGMNWTGLSQGRPDLANTVMNLHVP